MAAPTSPHLLRSLRHRNDRLFFTGQSVSLIGMTAIAASNTLIQTLVQENLRGRVMAFYTMAFLGTMPLGSLASGIIAERLNAPITIALGGFACAATGAWFMSRLASLRAVVRPIYIERGILTP